MASFVPYLKPNAASISPSPVIPVPVRLPLIHLSLILNHKFFSILLVSSLSGSLSIFSIILSIFSNSKSTISSIYFWAIFTVSMKTFSLKYASTVNGFSIKEYKFNSKSLQLSESQRVISPHGFTPIVSNPKSE